MKTQGARELSTTSHLPASGTVRVETAGRRITRELLLRVVEAETADRLIHEVVARSGEFPSEPRALFAFLRNALGELLIREVGPRIATTWLDVARAKLCERPRRVWLIDDNLVARQGLVRALIREGVEVTFDDDGSPIGIIVRREQSGWSIEGSSEPPIVSVSALVQSIRERLAGK